MGSLHADQAGAVLAEFVSGTRQVPIETYFIDSRSAAFLQVRNVLVGFSV